MKTFFLCAVLTLPIASSAQQVFSIKGEGKEFKEGDKIFLQYKSPQGVITDSIVVKTSYNQRCLLRR